MELEIKSSCLPDSGSCTSGSIRHHMFVSHRIDCGRKLEIYKQPKRWIFTVSQEWVRGWFVGLAVTWFIQRLLHMTPTFPWPCMRGKVLRRLCSRFDICQHPSFALQSVVLTWFTNQDWIKQRKCNRRATDANLIISVSGRRAANVWPA